MGQAGGSVYNLTNVEKMVYMHLCTKKKGAICFDLFEHNINE
jgi:hypothetical protein